MLNQMQLIFLLLRHQEKVKNSVDTCKVKTSVNEPSWIAGFIPVKYGCRCCFGNVVLYWKVHGLHDSPQGNTWNNVAYLFSSAKDLSRKHPVISRNKKQFEKRIVYFLFRLSLSRNLTTFVCVCVFQLKGIWYASYVRHCDGIGLDISWRSSALVARHGTVTTEAED